VKNYGESKIQRFACGANGEDYNWTEVMMAKAGRSMNGLSLHYYTIPTGSFRKKGPATGFGEAEWHATLFQTLKMEQIISKHGAIMDKHDPQKRVGMIIDEWGTWYDPTAGTNPGFLEQQNTLRDALVAGINFNIFHKRSDRVTMANIAQTINVLQAMILTDKEKMILTPTYHVFEMYKAHQGAALLPTEGTAPDYVQGEQEVPAVHASASRGKDGKITFSLVNLDPNRPAKVTAKISGASPKSVKGRIITATALDTHNSFDKPEAIKPADFTEAKVTGDSLATTLPPKSVVVLSIE